MVPTLAADSARPDNGGVAWVCHQYDHFSAVNWVRGSKFWNCVTQTRLGWTIPGRSASKGTHVEPASEAQNQVSKRAAGDHHLFTLTCISCWGQDASSVLYVQSVVSYLWFHLYLKCCGKNKGPRQMVQLDSCHTRWPGLEYPGLRKWKSTVYVHIYCIHIQDIWEREINV